MSARSRLTAEQILTALAELDAATERGPQDPRPLEEARQVWPFRPTRQPLAVMCAAELDDTGTLCGHLRGACPDHPVCAAGHPFDPSTRCLRRGCDGKRHTADGDQPWDDTEETEARG